MGSGLPTAGSTHETVLKVEPNARILYVDIEESAVEQGNMYIRETGWEEQVGMIQSNALEPTAPVTMLMFAVVHFWTDAQYTAVLDYWKATLAKGSAFAITHGTGDGRTAEQLEGILEVYKSTSMPVVLRSREGVALVMEGWDVVQPGLVRPHLWKPDELMEDEEEWPMTKMVWAAVGFLR